MKTTFLLSHGQSKLACYAMAGKTSLKTTILSLLLMLVAAPLAAENVSLSTPTTMLVVDVTKGEEPQFVYYGPRLTARDLAVLPAPRGYDLQLYPAYGAVNTTFETTLAMRHADGNLSTHLLAEGYTTESVTDKAPNDAERKAQLLTVTLRDPVYATLVRLRWLAYQDVDIIESWAEITNEEKRTVTLTQYLSSRMPIRRGDVWLSHLHGSWGAEGQLTEEPLQPGLLRIKDKDGLRNAVGNRQEVMFSLDGKPRENEGRVIGAALMSATNYAVNIDTDDSEHHAYSAGVNPDNSEYHLKRGETLTTPHVAYTYTAEGLSGASRQYHRWARAYQLRHADQPRDILLNSWEGTYMNINHDIMRQMMKDIKQMGGELFVMDDGWFGTKYPRKTDNAALGDWLVDPVKLPRGINGLIADAKAEGVKFGIWIEPEMVNTTSMLYEKHPDWIIKAPGRKPEMGRGGTQVVLDLTNPKVQDAVFTVVDTLLTNYPQIAYIKWDCNANIMNHGSQYLPMADQSHLEVAYHEGLRRVLERIRAKYPDVVIQDCASGGGRVNYGLLPYFDEFWTSDNTDALQRIRIQWGTSYFFPAIAMAAHISAVPNHAMHRTTALKFRCDVAMSGRLGMEIQPRAMTEQERQFCRQTLADYKRIRPIVQFGDLYRLHSPYEPGNVASLMYVTPDKRRAAFFWYKTIAFQNEHLPLVPLRGLDPTKMYKITELDRLQEPDLPFEGKTLSGEYLMSQGLDFPYTNDVKWNERNEWASRVFLLEEQK